MAEETPLPDNLSKLKVVELREELDRRGLSIEGLKKDVSSPCLSTGRLGIQHRSSYPLICSSSTVFSGPSTLN